MDLLKAKDEECLPKFSSTKITNSHHTPPSDLQTPKSQKTPLELSSALRMSDDDLIAAIDEALGCEVENPSISNSRCSFLSEDSDDVISGLREAEAQMAQLTCAFESSKVQFEREKQTWENEKQGFLADLKEKDAQICDLQKRLASQNEDERLANEQLANQLLASEKFVDKLSADFKEVEDLLSLRVQVNSELKNRIKTLEKEVAVVSAEKKKLEHELQVGQRVAIRPKVASTSHPLSPPLHLKSSSSSSHHLLLFGDGESQSGDASPPERPQLTKKDMSRILASNKYPKCSVFFSFDDYVTALKSHVKTLQTLGIDDFEIAVNLNNHLMGEELASSYAAHSRRMKPITLTGVFDAVMACDKASTVLTNSEKFQNIRQGQGEDFHSLMKRIENSFSDYQIGDPSDAKAKLRVIKNSFALLLLSLNTSETISGIVVTWMMWYFVS